MDAILHALTPLLQALAAALVSYLAAVVAKKLRVDLTETDERRLRELAQQGVLWAEEQARKAFAENGGVPPSSGQKLSMAVGFVEQGADRKRLKAHKKLAPSDLKDLVEAELGRLRSEGVDAAMAAPTLPPPRPRAD